MPAGRPLPLNNPGFEEQATAENIPGWEIEQHVGPPGEVAYDVTMDSAGASFGSSQSLRLTRLTKQAYALVHQTVPVPSDAAGKQLTFSARLKTRDVGPDGWLMTVTMNSADGRIGGVMSKPLTGTSGWQRVDLAVTVRPGTRSVDVGFLLLDSGTGWADDASLTLP
jgi:hypothetical protein